MWLAELIGWRYVPHMLRKQTTTTTTAMSKIKLKFCHPPPASFPTLSLYLLCIACHISHLVEIAHTWKKKISVL